MTANERRGASELHSGGVDGTSVEREVKAEREHDANARCEEAARTEERMAAGWWQRWRNETHSKYRRMSSSSRPVNA